MSFKNNNFISIVAIPKIDDNKVYLQIENNQSNYTIENFFDNNSQKINFNGKNFVFTKGHIYFIDKLKEQLNQVLGQSLYHYKTIHTKDKKKISFVYVDKDIIDKERYLYSISNISKMATFTFYYSNSYSNLYEVEFCSHKYAEDVIIGEDFCMLCEKYKTSFDYDKHNVVFLEVFEEFFNNFIDEFTE